MHGISTQEERNAMSAALDLMLVNEVEALYNREVELEVLMCKEGAEQFRTGAETAQQRGQMSHLRPFRKLTETLLVPLSDGLDTWKAEWAEGKRGRKPLAYAYLKDFPSDVAALITVRDVLDRLGTHAEGGNNNRRILSVAKSIGRRLMGEARMLAWQEQNPNLWGAVQHGLDNQKATAVHRARVNINRFNTKVKDTIEWEDWPYEAVLRVGIVMLELLVIHSGGRIDMVQDVSIIRKAAKHEAPLMLHIDEELSATLFKALADEEAYHPVYMPMVVKPTQWSTLRDGGYHTELLRGKRLLVRFTASHEEQKAMATRELSNVEMPRVYDAINTIQEVPWRVNRDVYNIAMHCWESDLAIAGMPRRTKLDVELLCPRPVEADTDPIVDKVWRQKAAEMHGFNARLPNRVLKASRSLKIAGIYLNDKFYFPHFLDFRGRMYPVPTFLQPQGEDLARGLLTFAEAKPVDEKASFWLAVHLANVWGNDKLTFDERYDWVVANEEMWRSMAEAPLDDRRWAGRSDAWQTLAAVFEWVRYLNEGPGMLSNLPIRVDGTCNGIQHLSAMIRDEDGGASVNLIPDDHPHDIYKEVATILEDMFRMLADEGGHNGMLAARWLEATGGSFDRSLTKRPVMIFPYGGTQRAYRKYILDWIKEFDPTREKFPRDETAVEMLNLMSDMMWAAVGEKLSKAREVQKWLQLCAKLACHTGAPLTWTTPSGFVVRHFYGKREERRIKISIDGQRIDLRDWTTTAELDNQEHLKGIPPNFTHSMDASVLHTTVNKAYNAGIDSLTGIHDAYGTVAADVDLLNACLRESFVWTYSQPILKQFRDACLEVLDDDWVHAAAMPRVPQMGSLDIDGVLDSDYFFA